MRVLLVEDETLIADAIQVSLSRDGYRVDCVADAETAEDALATSSFDLVLLDLGLPGRDGLSVLPWMRAAKILQCRVALVTLELEHHVVDLGFDLFGQDVLAIPGRPRCMLTHR